MRPMATGKAMATGRASATDQAMRIVRGLQWRVARRSRLLVVRCTCPDADLVCPDGFRLVRVRGNPSAQDRALVDAAMRAVGESVDLVAPRFAHGDDFFGWQAGNEIASFGWVMYRDRRFGPIRVAEAPGRAFTFNFHTLNAYRGRGLYQDLLYAIRVSIGRDGMKEIVGDVDVRNGTSLRAIQRAGFAPLTHVSYLTLLDRWELPLGRPLLDPDRL